MGGADKQSWPQAVEKIAVMLPGLPTQNVGPK